VTVLSRCPSSGLGAGQPDVHVLADVDLDELGQPRRLPHPGELFDQLLVLLVGEMDDAPQVDWSLLAAPDRMLHVEARLSSARTEVAPGVVGQFCLAGERHRLLMVVQVGPFEDQPVVVAGDTESMPVPIPDDGVITLRPWRYSDATWYAEASRDDAIQRFTTEPADLTAADVVAALRVSNARADRAAFLVCSADGVRRLGNLAVEYCGDVAHVSYWVAADVRGQGVAARALSLLLTMLRDDTQVRVVDLWTHVDNIGSRRAAEQAGFIRDPTADCERIVKGAVWPTVAYHSF